jgi:aminoglycoside phosphotransferase (APT) family kinase protein
VYEEETFAALDALGDEVDRAACERVWAQARATAWEREPVWFHGDVAVNNLLVREGLLAGVLDFGSSGVGDPACDVVIAWTFFAEAAARERFRAELAWDSDTWARGRGWALWKALISLRGDLGSVTLREEIARIVAQP